MRASIIVSVHKRLSQFNAALAYVRVVRYALLLFALFLFNTFFRFFSLEVQCIVTKIN